MTGGARTVGELAFGLRIETSFVPFYHGQPFFADVDSFMRAQGFEFIDFARQTRRPRVKGVNLDSDGAANPPGRSAQLIQADPVYFRAPAGCLNVWRPSTAQTAFAISLGR